MTVGAVILAAGFGRRFSALEAGSDKRLYALGNNTVAQTTVATYRRVFSQVRVVVRPDDNKLINQLDDFDIEVCIAKDAHQGMGHSLAAGFENLPWRYAFVALLDMPFILNSTLNTIKTHALKHPDKFIRPHYVDAMGKRSTAFGHPIGIPSQYFSEVTKSSGDTGAKRLLQAHVDLVLGLDLNDPGIIQDIDVPGDLGRGAPT
ncbi:MAG: nucleotidyltransferase family protein [Gammaproteobacteria bacterium]|nr:nucleotidyltransferase family protein [Gammaproteobacteria bacterium]